MTTIISLDQAPLALFSLDGESTFVVPGENVLEARRQAAIAAAAAATLSQATDTLARVTRTLRVLIDTDSLGYGQGTTNPGPYGTTGWPARMSAALTSFMGLVAGGSGSAIAVEVRNRSVGGSYSGTSFNRLTADLAAEMPHLVLLMDTPNDARSDAGNVNLKDTETNFRKMIGLCRIFGSTPIVITSAPIGDGARYPSAGVYDANSDVRRLANCALLRSLAAELNVRLIDVDAALSSNQDWAKLYTQDDIHPGDIGANMIGTIIARGLAALPMVKFFGANLARDTFTRANSTTTLSATETGALPYLPLSGVFGILNNTGYLFSGANARTGVNTAKADHEAQADLILGTGAAGVEVRQVDGANALSFLFQGSGTYRLRLGKWVAGVFTTLANTNLFDALTGTHNFRLSASGRTLTAYLDGAPVLSYTLTTAEQAIYGSANNAGIYCQSPGAAASAFDNFVVRRL